MNYNVVKFSYDSLLNAETTDIDFKIDQLILLDNYFNKQLELIKLLYNEKPSLTLLIGGFYTAPV